MADLEADVDEPPSDFEDEWEEVPEEAQENEEITEASSSAVEQPAIHADDDTDELEDPDDGEDDGHTALASQPGGITSHLDDRPVSPVEEPVLHAPRATPVPIGISLSVPAGPDGQISPPDLASQYALARAETAGPDGPMTPRNDAGPFVLDGSAGRSERRPGIGNLESVVHEE